MRKAVSSTHNYESDIQVSGPDDVLERIQNIGRTEDVKFSPDCRKLVVAGFRKSRLLILDIEILPSCNGTLVRLIDYIEIKSSALNRPHGVDFIDSETIIVANRRGITPIFKIPTYNGGSRVFDIEPELILGNDESHYVDTPGSVSVVALNDNQYEVLVCNNYADHISRHILEFDKKLTLKSSEKFLSNGLEVPDGVAVSPDNRWIAISNHNKNCVYLYINNKQLDTQSEPDGILRDVIYPHGIRFTPDDKYILVADAGAPYVNVYAKDGEGWGGAHAPKAVVRALEDDLYWQGRVNPTEGGIKGIDIDLDMNLLVTTCEKKPLQFLDLSYVLEQRGVPFDKRMKHLWWRHGWRVENLRKKLKIV